MNNFNFLFSVTALDIGFYILGDLLRSSNGIKLEVYNLTKFDTDVLFIGIKDTVIFYIMPTRNVGLFLGFEIAYDFSFNNPYEDNLSDKIMTLGFDAGTAFFFKNDFFVNLHCLYNIYIYGDKVDSPGYLTKFSAGFGYRIGFKEK